MMQTIADLAIILGQTPELSLVVKMTIAAGIGLAVVRLSRVARASVRHLVLTSTFAALLVLPLAMLIAPAVAIELPWARAVAGDALAAGVMGIAAPGLAVKGAGHAGDVRDSRDVRHGRDGRVVGDSLAGDSRTGLSASSLMPWLAMMRVVWLAGAVMLLGMLAIQLVRLRAVRRTGLPWMERRAEAMRMARESGVNRPVTVMLHEGVAAPLTCGWRNPVVLFPADARTWNDDDVRRVLLHELEHVRRGDWVVQLAARVTCAIYWFHPLVWTTWRQLCLEAERACDDEVVRSEEGTEYAEQLVQLARRMSRASAHPMVAMASRGDLSTRVTALLDQHQRRGRAGMTTFVAAIGAAAFVVITIAPLRAVAAVGIDSQAISSGSGDGIAGGVAGGAAHGVAAGIPGGIPGGVPGGVAGGVAGSVERQRVRLDEKKAERIAEDQPARVDEKIKTKEDTHVYDVRVVKKQESRVERAKYEALIEAADDGDIESLKELLSSGIDVNAKVNGDGSPLIAASRKGEIAAVKFLLERGADVNMPVRGDGSPLIAAAAHGHPDVVTLLLDQGADIEMIVDGDENALIQAAFHGYLDVVKLLVTRGANVNSSVTVGILFNGNPQTETRTPLSMARRGGHADVVAFLQSAGAVQ